MHAATNCEASAPARCYGWATPYACRYYARAWKTARSISGWCRGATRGKASQTETRAENSVGADKYVLSSFRGCPQSLRAEPGTQCLASKSHWVPDRRCAASGMTRLETRSVFREGQTASP